jgi:tRNA threonylcarbamoyladenosine biosynthesis protein TsaB
VRILALDTATPVTSCALLDDERILREQSFDPPAKAGDLLPEALGDLEGIEAVAVGLGPGSFTGLRVGLAAAKAIAYARKLPLAGASSLQAIAFGEQGLVYATTPARKGELFLQPFEDGVPTGPVEVRFEADLQLPPGTRLIRTVPRAAAVGRLCLPRLQNAAYDAAVCFGLAPDYVQDFPAKGVSR